MHFYKHVITLVTVETADFMITRWIYLGYISCRIINEPDGDGGVIYYTAGKPSATIELE